MPCKDVHYAGEAVPLFGLHHRFGRERRKIQNDAGLPHCGFRGFAAAVGFAPGLFFRTALLVFVAGLVVLLGIGRGLSTCSRFACGADFGGQRKDYNQAVRRSYQYGNERYVEFRFAPEEA